MKILDVVKFSGLTSKDWLIYKYPSEELALGSQLIVQEGQIAVLVKEGKICGSFTAGTHTITSNVLPILKSLIKIPFSGKAPFTAEIFFVNIALLLDVPWGTSDPIQLIDPKYNVKLRIRAFGSFGLKIKDGVTLIKNLIGAMQFSEIVSLQKVSDYFKGLIVNKIKTTIANAIINDRISALEISSSLEKISKNIQEQIKDDFDSFGLNISYFMIKSINFPDEDFSQINSILQDKAAFDIMGDSRYATKRQFDIYETAASNSYGLSGAFASAAVGLETAAVMSDKIKGNYCPKCGNKLSPGVKFCPSCGERQSLICKCGAKLEFGSRFCPQCGNKVGDSNEEK